MSAGPINAAFFCVAACSGGQTIEDYRPLSICNMVKGSFCAVQGHSENVSVSFEMSGRSVTSFSLVVETTLFGQAPTSPVSLSIDGALQDDAGTPLGPVDVPESIFFLGKYSDGRVVVNPSGGLFWPSNGKLFDRGFYSTGITRSDFDQHLSASLSGAVCPTDPMKIPN